MNFSIATLLVIILAVVLLVVILLKAMKSKYSVQIDFTFLAGAFHLNMKPNATYSDKLNDFSPSNTDEAINK